MTISRHSGFPIARDAHIGQSVQDILSTPIGSRVMRRDYGSDLPDLIDAPINGETMIHLVQATAEALDRWEPRLTVERVEIVEARAGFVEFHILADVEGQAQTITAEVAA